MDPFPQLLYINNGSRVDGEYEEYSLVLQERQIFVLVCTCFFISILCYTLSHLQGKIKAREHNGLKLFWEVIMYGEVMSMGLCIVFLVLQYSFHTSDVSVMMCLTLNNINVSAKVSMAYVWLLIWLIFVVSVLRTTTAITWLHQLKTVEKLKDMGRGIGILTATLLYIFPVALLSRHSGTMKNTEESDLPYLCLPVWFVLASPRNEGIVITVGYAIGVLIACFSELCTKSYHRSLLAMPIALVTHFFPTYFFCMWASDTLHELQIPVGIGMIYCIVAALNSFSNLLSYKLLPLSSDDENKALCEVKNTEKQFICDLKYPLKSRPVYSDHQSFIV